MRAILIDLAHIKYTCKKRKAVCDGFAKCPYFDAEEEECLMEELSKQPDDWELYRFKGEEDDF